MEKKIRQITSFSTFPSARPKTIIFSAGHDKQVTALCKGGGKKRDKSFTLLTFLPDHYIRQLMNSKTTQTKKEKRQTDLKIGLRPSTLKLH